MRLVRAEAASVSKLLSPNVLVDKFTCGRLAEKALIQTISQYQAVYSFSVTIEGIKMALTRDFSASIFPRPLLFSLFREAVY